MLEEMQGILLGSLKDSLKFHGDGFKVRQINLLATLFGCMGLGVKKVKS